MVFEHSLCQTLNLAKCNEKFNLCQTISSHKTPISCATESLFVNSSDAISVACREYLRILRVVVVQFGCRLHVYTWFEFIKCLRALQCMYTGIINGAYCSV